MRLPVRFASHLPRRWAVGCLSFVALGSLTLGGCVQDGKDGDGTTTTPDDTAATVVAPPYQKVAPPFSADTAYAYVARQVGFGPRVPNTPGHVKAGDYLIKTLKANGAAVTVQATTLKAHNGDMLKIRNVIAAYNPKAARRIALFAHWDTRPVADQDVTRQKEPILGANDGASGVGVLMEVGRALQGKLPPNLGVDIVLVDAEDYGSPGAADSYALGTQYWAKNLSAKNKPYAGILLDMVGAPGATFTMEGNSQKYAPALVQQVWATAGQLGHGNHFVYFTSDFLTDDHLYVNTIAGIPTIDIIHIDLKTGSFADYWHTHADNMGVVDRNTLEAVGETVLEYIFREAGATAAAGGGATSDTARPVAQ